jgi:hypothetical protein
MWEKIFTPDAVFYMQKVTGDTEDFNTINGFINHLKQRVDYKTVIILATQWKAYDDVKQANIAIQQAGVFHASRFILLMDFLSKKFVEGKLK